MSEKKRFSAFDIVNIVILALGLVFVVISFFQAIPFKGITFTTEFKVVDILTKIVSTAALICGVLYMVARYTKKAAVLYKVFMSCFVVYNALFVLFMMTIGSGSMVGSVCIVACLLFGNVLATARDFGKIKTFVVAGLVLIANIVILIIAIKMEIFTLFMAGNFLLAMEACVMVLAKFRDKALRHAE